MSGTTIIAQFSMSLSYNYLTASKLHLNKRSITNYNNAIIGVPLLFNGLGYCMVNANVYKELKPRLYAQFAPGANIHPGCKFAPGVYFGHVNGV